MALEMKGCCERCKAALDPHGEACICSFECTFCPACAEALKGTCPNCGGELVRRPKRKPARMVDDLNGNSLEAESIAAQSTVAG